MIHNYSAFVALAVGVMLTLDAHTTQAKLGCLVHTISMTTMFGVSAAYHRPTWTPEARAFMRKVGACLGRMGGEAGAAAGVSLEGAVRALPCCHVAPAMLCFAFADTIQAIFLIIAGTPLPTSTTSCSGSQLNHAAVCCQHPEVACAPHPTRPNSPPPCSLTMPPSSFSSPAPTPLWHCWACRALLPSAC